MTISLLTRVMWSDEDSSGVSVYRVAMTYYCNEKVNVTCKVFVVMDTRIVYKSWVHCMSIIVYPEKYSDPAHIMDSQCTTIANW